MKRIIVFALLLALVGCASSRNAQDDAVNRVPWETTNITIDGNDADWTQMLPFEDKKMGLAYGFSVDSNYLYLRVLSHNEYTTLNILKAGMTVYINKYGVKEDAGAAGIAFPTGNRPRKEGNMLNERTELQMDRRFALQQVSDYMLFGFPGLQSPETYDYLANNPLGIDMAVGLNPAGELIYEAKVPLSMFPAGRRNLAVGIYIDQLPGMNSRGGGGGGISIGGGIGMGSFGRGGGVGLSIGSGSLANIGGRSKGKTVKIWKEIVVR